MNARRQSASPKHRDWRPAAIACGAGLIVYVAIAYFVLGPELSAIWQRLLGLGCAVLALATFALVTQRPDMSEEMLRRARMGQHPDFGRLRRAERQKPRTVQLPGFGEVSLRAMCGTAVFVLVFAWWLTPLAPVGVSEPAKVDLATPLGEEIVAVVLVLPDGATAVLQPPIVPLRAEQLARQMEPNGHNSYNRALKAIAEGRFNRAKGWLAAASRSEEVDAQQVRIARAHNDMYAGRFADAAAGYSRALVDEPDDPMLVCQAAVAWMHAGQLGRAEQLITGPMAIAGKDLDKDSPHRAACLLVQAVFHACRSNNYSGAELLCLHARRGIEEISAREDPFAAALVAASLNNQSVLYAMRAKNAGAVELGRGALQIWSGALGPYNPLVAASLANGAMIHRNQGHYAEAEQRLASVAMYSGGLAAEHPARVLSRIANIVLHLAQGRYTQAQHTSTGIESGLGADSPLKVVALATFADVYAEQARYARAEAYYRRALEVGERIWTPQHVCLAGIRERLARVYIAQGRFDDAQSACQLALDVLKKAFGNQKHPAIAAGLHTRGRVEIERGRPRAARPYLEEALEARRALFGNDHPDVARTLAILAALDDSPETYDRGAKRYLHAIETFETLLGADHAEHPEVARLYTGLAALHVRRGNRAEAEQCLAQALAIQRKAIARKGWSRLHPELAATLEAYAALLEAKDPAESDRAAELAAEAQSIHQNRAEAERRG